MEDLIQNSPAEDSRSMALVTNVRLQTLPNAIAIHHSQTASTKLHASAPSSENRVIDASISAEFKSYELHRLAMLLFRTPDSLTHNAYRHLRSG
jgi:hypothetical protein